MIKKKSQPNKIKVNKGREFAGEFKKICKVERLQTSFTMIETKVASAEQEIRSFKKNIFPLHERLWIQVHSQIVSIR